MKYIVLCGSFILFLFSGSSPSWSKHLALCKFSLKTFEFKGTPADQVKCLLRKIKMNGSSSSKQVIPEWLTMHVGKQTNVQRSSFRKYLVKYKILETDLGGNIDKPLISTKRKDGRMVQAQYFVIHDTATANKRKRKSFPDNMNTSKWRYNNLNSSLWNSTSRKVNLIINRLGNSRTFIDYEKSRQGIAVKLEYAKFAKQAKSMFLHVENVQPRIQPHPFKGKFFPMGPTPGFTDVQLRRLALAYIAASVRRGTWLIPAFHFNIDHGLKNYYAHNDPQEFDLPRWIDQVEHVLNSISR
ncbi:MAG: hypothetical protein GY927_23795 [bacterium]|nr:hypothetical protein [bacterium]